MRGSFKIWNPDQIYKFFVLRKNFAKHTYIFDESRAWKWELIWISTKLAFCSLYFKSGFLKRTNFNYEQTQSLLELISLEYFGFIHDLSFLVCFESKPKSIWWSL